MVGVKKYIGAYNPISGIIAEEEGFDGLWISGLEISTSLGVPDTEFVPRSYYLQIVRSIRKICDLPIMVDCDTGYGNPENLFLATQDYIAAGASAICIEDKLYPKSNSFSDKSQELEDPIKFTQKIRAAKAAAEKSCGNSKMNIVARVESLISGASLEDAMMRANIYVEAGADAILIHDKEPTGEAIIEFGKKWECKVPLIAVPTMYYQKSSDELHRAGYGVVIYANHGIRSTVSTLKKTMRSILLNNGTSSLEDEICSVGELFRLQNKVLARFDEKNTRD